MKNTILTIIAGLFVAGLVMAAETKIQMYQGAEQESSMVVASTTLSTTATTSFFFMAPNHPTTISKVYCFTDVGTSTITFQGTASTSQSMTCGSAGTDTILASNNAYNVREKAKVNIGSLSATTNYVTITVTKTTSVD